MLFRKQKDRSALTASVAAVALVAACGTGNSDGEQGDSSADGMISITAGVSASQSSIPIILGDKQGFFEEEGIDLTIDYAATGAGAIPQLLNGQLHVALGGISGPITAVAENIPIVIVSGSVRDREDPEGTQYQTMVPGDSDIKSFADLEGKTIAVNSLQCCWEFWIREAIEKDGGDPSSPNLVQLPFSDAATALRQGKVDAISTLQPFATALRQEGFRDIGDSPAIAFDNPNNGNTVYTMSQQFIDENPEVVEKWRRALQRSSEYANSHPDETRAQIIEQTGADAELIKNSPLPEYSAELDLDSIEKESKFLVKYGVLDKAPSLDSLVAP